MVELKKRIIPYNDREYIVTYLIGNKLNHDLEIRDSFLDGVVCLDMSKELVSDLYGIPDTIITVRESNTVLNMHDTAFSMHEMLETNREVWVYEGTNTKIIGMIEFQDSSVVDLVGGFKDLLDDYKENIKSDGYKELLNR